MLVIYRKARNILNQSNFLSAIPVTFEKNYKSSETSFYSQFLLLFHYSLSLIGMHTRYFSSFLSIRSKIIRFI